MCNFISFSNFFKKQLNFGYDWPGPNQAYVAWRNRFLDVNFWAPLKSFKIPALTLLPGTRPERIEWFIEYQAFSPSYYSAHRPPPFRPCLFSKLSLFRSLPVRRRSSLLTKEGSGGGGGWATFQSYDGEKAWSSINHSKISGPGKQTENIWFGSVRKFNKFKKDYSCSRLYFLYIPWTKDIQVEGEGFLSLRLGIGIVF
jgi:hypothetical protein